MVLSSLVYSPAILCTLFSALAFSPSVAAQGDSSQECTPYYYAPVGDQKANFPTSWTVATIVPGDTEAQTMFESIQSQIPNISPKGQQPQSLTGNWSGFTYDPSDPDCWWTWQKCTTPKAAGLPDDISMLPEPNVLGYGFDDGPNCSHNAFYDYLKSKDQTATMFYIGSNVMDWPLEAQRALADGHQVCALTALTNDQAFAEFWYTMKIIKLAIGVTPTCWRPPYGDVDDRIRFIANALGLTNIMWQYDSNDWRVGTNNITSTDVDNNYLDLINAAKNGTFSTHGTIMLTHELNNFTMSEVVKFYDQLASAFSYMVPIGVAFNVSDPYIEGGYSLPSFDQYASGTHVGSITGNGTNNGGPFASLTNGTSGGSSGGSSFGGSGTSGGTSSSNSSNKSGAAKVSLDGAGYFAGVLGLVGGIMTML
ncbi:carbohydrate esterase family 4 protein [Scleroderma yunnanense]